MNKTEKQIAAFYLASCLNEMRLARQTENTAAYERAETDFIKYKGKLREMLTMKYEMFGLEYAKSVDRPTREVFQMAQAMYNNLVNGNPAY